ncbi:MAG: S8 family peptidase [Bacteriovoracales bacterium]|nr:S8 family peptidase [Bacteriovoracales bacterium]
MKKTCALLLLSCFFAVTAFSASFLAKVDPEHKDWFLYEGQENFANMRTFSTSFGEFVEFDAYEESVDDLYYHEAMDYTEYVERNDFYFIDPIDEDPFESLDSVYTPEDELYSRQWALKNTGTNALDVDAEGRAGVDMNAEMAWGITRGDSRLKIAVIDTGVDYNHPDLVDNMWINEAEFHGEEGVDDDGNGFVDDIHGYDFVHNDGDPMDDHSHGTHCAGIIAATHDQTGIAGLMGDVQIVAIKFLGRRGGGSLADAVKSIDYAMKVGVHIMSNSWGGGGFNQALYDAIFAAKEKGILFVAAAGNSNNNNDKRPSYPATYDIENVISVGAMDSSGKRASFSSYGAKTVDIFAPGAKILSSVLGGKYKSYSGTSMATPYVSAALGLLLAMEMNTFESLMSFGEIKDRLIETSIMEPNLEGRARGGRVDTYRLLMDEREGL